MSMIAPAKNRITKQEMKKALKNESPIENVEEFENLNAVMPKSGRMVAFLSEKRGPLAKRKVRAKQPVQASLE